MPLLPAQDIDMANPASLSERMVESGVELDEFIVQGMPLKQKNCAQTAASFYAQH
jgi:hypothetical protein